LAPAVRTLDGSEVDRGIAPIVTAFASDPIMRWFYSDPLQYWTYCPRLVKAFAGSAFEHGTAFGVEGYFATALWLPPGVLVDDEAMGAIVEESIPPSDLEQKAGLIEQQAAFHPHDPHWYLPLIGVDPWKQGKGYGTALLRHSLQNCDRDGLIAYLESTNPRNNPLYERFGFEVIGVIQAADSPPMWPMLRKPRS
jgi:ribosomal protein S18 acetylase RimI-like enzyme